MSVLDSDDLIVISRIQEDDQQIYQSNYRITFSPLILKWLKNPKQWVFKQKYVLNIVNDSADIMDYDSEWFNREKEIQKMHPSDRPYIPYTLKDIKDELQKLIHEFRSREIICRFKVNGEQVSI